MNNKSPSYKSPLKKLVRFFEQSRDKWKSKCLDRYILIRPLKNQIRNLESSRFHWKNKTVQLKDKINTQISQLSALENQLSKQISQLSALENQLSKLKKNQTLVPPIDLKKTHVKSNKLNLEAFNIVPAYHTYSVGHIMLFISLVLDAASSLHAAAKSISIIAQILPISRATPSWTCGRLWLLRLGYYKLIRPKIQANDWIWIADHTVQIGVEKCFVILGIRLNNLPAPGQYLKHIDVEPITLSPVTKSNGQVVYEQLEASIEKTGIPREIVGDYGSDLKTGIEKFCQAHPETCYIYDIKHKTASVLKSELKNNQRWQDFTSQASATKNQLQQTPLAHLAPQNQKTKARYMNLDTLVKWGQNTLVFLDKQEKTPNPYISQEQLREKLGWLTTFRESLKEWDEMFFVICTTETFVRKQGIYSNCFLDLSFILPFNNFFKSTDRVIEKLLININKESSKCRFGERLLGSSEVLESSFGKQKRVESDQAKSGFTGLILGIAAMVSTTTTDIVKQAFETVSTRDVLLWCQNMLGKSVQARRKEVFSGNKNGSQI